MVTKHIAEDVALTGPGGCQTGVKLCSDGNIYNISCMQGLDASAISIISGIDRNINLLPTGSGVIYTNGCFGIGTCTPTLGKLQVATTGNVNSIYASGSSTSSSNAAIYACSTACNAIIARACCIGVYGLAVKGLGVVGIASDGAVTLPAVTCNCYGGYFYAKCNYGLYSCVDCCIAIYAMSTGSCAIVGRASGGFFGVIGCANSYAVVGYAGNDTGVYGCATCLGVMGFALCCGGVVGQACGGCGVYGCARSSNYGVYGYAVSCTGLQPSGCQGVYGYAEQCYGVYGKAVRAYGVYGWACTDYALFGSVTCECCTGISTNGALTVGLPSPSEITLTCVGGGAGKPSGQYYYRVSAFNTMGESVASLEQNICLSAAGCISIAWCAVPNSCCYRVYGDHANPDNYCSTVSTGLLDTGTWAGFGGTPPVTGACNVYLSSNCTVNSYIMGCLGVGTASPSSGRVQVVTTTTNGIYASGASTADTAAAVYACSTQCYAIVAKADVKCAIVARAPRCAIYAEVDTDTAIYAATTGTGSIAIYGYSNTSTGVYGSAQCNYGTYGYAGCNYGVFGCAATGQYGVYGRAPSYGVFAYAEGDYAIGAQAVNYGALIEASCNYGALIQATGSAAGGGCYGIVGKVSRCYGVYGCAGYVCVGCYGVFGTFGAIAGSNYAVYGCVPTGYETCVGLGTNGAIVSTSTTAVNYLLGCLGVGTASPSYKIHAVTTGNTNTIYASGSSTSSSNAAIYACSTACNAIIAKASCIGVYSIVSAYGVLATAICYGISGYASCEYAGYFESKQNAIYATTSSGNTAIYGVAYGTEGGSNPGGCLGVKGYAQYCYGVFGCAGCYAVVGMIRNSAGSNYAVYGCVPPSYEACIGLGTNGAIVSTSIIATNCFSSDIKLAKNSIIGNYITVDVSGIGYIDTIADVSGDGAIWHYVVKDGTNFRAGTIIAVWNATTNIVKYNEVHTDDIGDTTGVTFAVIDVGNIIKLQATTITGGWSIKVIRNII